MKSLKCFLLLCALLPGALSAQESCDPGVQSRSINVGPRSFTGEPSPFNPEFAEAGQRIAEDWIEAAGTLGSSTNFIPCPSNCAETRDAEGQIMLTLHGSNPWGSCYAQYSRDITVTGNGLTCSLAKLAAGIAAINAMQELGEELCQEAGDECHAGGAAINSNAHGNQDDSGLGCTYTVTLPMTFTCSNGEPTSGGEFNGFWEVLQLCDPLGGTVSTPIPDGGGGSSEPPPDPVTPGDRPGPYTGGCGLNGNQCDGTCPFLGDKCVAMPTTGEIFGCLCVGHVEEPPAPAEHFTNGEPQTAGSKSSKRL